MKKIIIIVVAVLVAGVGGAASAVLILGSDSDADVVESVEGEAAEPEVVEETRDPIYWSLDPKFTITYNAGGLRYLQLSMEAMSYEQKAIDSLKANMPAVRNSVIMLLSAQEFESLTSMEGKEALRGSVLETVQQAIRSDEQLEEIFFTTFILQ